MHSPGAPGPRWRALVPWLCGAIAFAIAAKNLLATRGDLGIFLEVGREWRAGGFDLCRERPETGPWVYPPWVALPFAALDALFGDRTIRWLWSLGLGLATAWLLRAVARAMQPFGGLAWWQWLAFGVLFQRCIAQNLTHGQLSLWVGALATAGIVALQRRHDGRAGILLGLAAALKITPLLFVVALPLMRRPRAALTMLGTVAVLVLLLPWPFAGTGEHLRHLAEFGRAAFASVYDAQNAAIVREHAGPSVKGALDYLLQPVPFDREGHLAAIADLGDGTLRIVELGWSLALAAMLAIWFARARGADDERRLAEQSAAVLLATVFFAPLVRTYHLAVLALPFARFCRGPCHRGRDPLWWLVTAGLLITLTLRQKNLLGEWLWRTLDAGAPLHLALIGLTVWCLRDARSITAPGR